MQYLIQMENNMKNKKIILLLGIVLLAVVGIMTNLIVAWLTDTGVTGPTEFTIGEVSYTLDGSFIPEESVVVPGQQLIALDTDGETLKKFTLTNNSTVGSELRFKIEVIHEVDEGDDQDWIEYLTITYGSGWTLADGYYYYRGTEATPEGDPATKHIIPAKDGDALVLDVITSIIIDGTKVGNAFQSLVFSITITFEAKQADYVTWAELGGIDFETGLAITP